MNIRGAEAERTFASMERRWKHTIWNREVPNPTILKLFNKTGARLTFTVSVFWQTHSVLCEQVWVLINRHVELVLRKPGDGVSNSFLGLIYSCRPQLQGTRSVFQTCPLFLSSGSVMRDRQEPDICSATVRMKDADAHNRERERERER